MPNAVGIFADALYGDGTAGSGDKARLFKDMEDGKLKLEELVKVIDYMKTLTKQDLLDRMLNTPAKKFTAMKNQWILMIEALNDSGVLDLMVAVFEEVALALQEVGKWVKDNKVLFEDFGTIIKTIYRAIKSLVKALFSLGEPLKYIALILAGGFLFLAFKPITTGKLEGSTLKAVTALNLLGQSFKTLLIRMLVIPIAAFLVVGAMVELYDTLLGKDTLFTRLSEQKDKGLLGWLAAITRGLFEILSLSAKGLVGGFHFITGNADERQAAADFLRESGQDFASKMDKMGFTAEMTRNWDTNKQAITDMFTGGGNQSIRYLGQNQNTSAPVNNTFNMTINPPSGDPIRIAEVVSETLSQSLSGYMTNYVEQR